MEEEEVCRREREDSRVEERSGVEETSGDASDVNGRALSLEPH